MESGQLGAERSVPAPVLGCLQALEECCVLVRALGAERYRHAAQGRSSIGAHGRHVLDHFLCFLRGWEEGTVDYDARDRNPGLESDPALFLDEADRIAAGLGQVAAAGMTAPVRVRQIPAKRAAAVEVPSTVERELLFLMSHTVHHVALMELMAAMLGVTTAAPVGVAYSTMDYRSRQGA